MRLVEIAKGISVNPEKVIAVKIVDKYGNKWNEEKGRDTAIVIGKKVVVVVEELVGESSDFTSLICSVEYDSDFTYEQTIEILSTD